MTTTPSSSASEERARIYNGRYELIRQIARGGTAQVYLARDLLLDRPVALKVLFPELSTDSSFVERFRREAQAAANLSHPNIVPVFDWGESERTYFIVMEYVDGEPLSAIIRSQAPLPAARAAGIAADIAKALSYAHRHGVVHRDVKPGNVLLTRDGQVKVTDFGIARAVGADDSVTQTGLVMGTATYFSPEQAQGLGVDGRSDVYALGVVLYEMVTGRPPFSADTPVAIAYKHVSEQAIMPRELEPRVPEALEAIIMRAMAKQPGARYSTAEDLYADLQRYAQGAPVLAMNGGAAFSDLGATQAVGLAPANRAATTVMAAGGAGGAAPTVADAALAPGDGGESAARQMPKRRWIGWAIAAVIFAGALAILVDVGGRSLGYFGAPGYFSMPDVYSKTVTGAESLLQGKDGLVVTTVAKVNNLPKGAVITQSPLPGKLVRAGDPVTVTYSSGPTQVAVPPTIGEQYVQAEEQIKAAGLVPVLVPQLPTQAAEQLGVVTSTDPHAQTRVNIHSVVHVYYIHGSLQVSVPPVAGDTVEKAALALAGANLSVGAQINQWSTTVKAGLVSGTQPAAGTKETAGTAIQIIVSTGPPSIVPQMVGQYVQQAIKALQKAGLNYSIQYVPGVTTDNNEVTNQSLPAGSDQNKGSTVVLTVVKAAVTTTTSTLPPTTTSTTSKGGGGHHHHDHQR